MSVHVCPALQDALLQRYVGQGSTYTDCYAAALPESVSLQTFIEAFYSTLLFRAERTLLQIALRRKITDADVTALAQGRADSFAVWRVDARRDREILLSDMSGHTRSYLAVDGVSVIFGSAVVAAPNAPLSAFATLTLPFHRQYSKALLGAAVRALVAGNLKPRAY